MLVCNSEIDANYPGNFDTVVRYNISQNDGPKRIFAFQGPITDTYVYNNVIYVPSTYTITQFARHGGVTLSDGVYYNNNIFLDQILNSTIDMTTISILGKDS